ncbi:cation:proton antiporter [Candidatus Bathyarchaeota archaeon]|nr:cation:proton antiporter [Candidatus Bathyarchaeota archaeon]
MESLTLSLILLFVVIAVAPLISRRIRLPVIIVEMLIGIILGDSMLKLIPRHPILDFFLEFGLTYLMFLAGLEMDLSGLKRNAFRVIFIAALSLLIPFLTGFYIAPYVGIHPLLLGTILSTTSLGLVIPLTREEGYDGETMQILLGSVIIVDVVSIFLLALSLTYIQGSLGYSFFYSLIAVILLFILPLLTRREYIQERLNYLFYEKSYFEIEVRLSFALIFILAAVSEIIGFHSIMGAFIAGVIISEITPKPSRLIEKLEGFGYGFFTPFFFILVGARADIPMLLSNLGDLKMLLLIVGCALISKILGAGLASLTLGISAEKSVAIGLLHSARLSLILAAAQICRELGVLSGEQFSVFIILAMISALVAPSLGRRFL